MQKRWVRLLALTLALVMVITFLFSALWAVLAQAAQPEDYEMLPLPEVGAEAYAVLDAATGQVLVEKNADSIYYPASITKIMTLALTLENTDLDSQGDALVPVSQTAVDALIPGATMVALQAGEEVPLRDLLYATQIESANDAANVLGEYIGGSMFMFATMMNDKARALGLKHSFFANPSGQPNADHVVTAREMAEITRWALGVPHFREIFGATQYQAAPTNMQAGGRGFYGDNLMLQPGSGYYSEGVNGGKSGYTDDARYTMVSTARRGDTELICVVLYCPSNTEKYTSSQRLLEYCFANFYRETYSAGLAQSFAVPVYGGGEKPLGDILVQGGGDVELLLHKGQDKAAIGLDFDIPQRYVIGEDFRPMAQVHVAGQLVAEVPLAWHGLEALLAENTHAAPMWVPKPSLGSRWLPLGIPVAVLVIALVCVLAARHRRRRLAARAEEVNRQLVSVSIAERPAPLAPPQRSGRAPGLQVARAGGPLPPRRVAQRAGAGLRTR